MNAAMNAAPQEERILVLAPTAADAALTDSLLCKAGFAYKICESLVDLAAELTPGVAVIVITEESIAGRDVGSLLEALEQQPQWSDVPIVFLTRSGADSPAAMRAMEILGNVTILDRPVRIATLVSALKTAVRGRRRQYELRQRIEALHRSEERFTLATQATSDAIWDLNLVRTADPSAREFTHSVFGWSAGEFKADPNAWRERVHPEDRAGVVTSLQAVLRGDQSLWSCEYRFRDAGGTYLHILDRAHITRNSLGQAVRAVGAMMDITERKLAEQQRTLYAAIVESTDDAIVSKSLDGVIRSWNPGAERLFGYTAEEAIGRNIKMIIPPDKLDEEAEILHRMTLGERIDHFETTRVTKYGRMVNISLAISPLRDSAGRVIGASKVARDITARKRAQEELRRQDELLELLWETAAVLLTTDKPDAMLRGVFDKIAPHLGLDAYFNYMLSESGELLVLETSGGVDKEQLEKMARLGVGQAVCGTVARERRSIAASYIQQSDDPLVQLVKGFGIRAYACNPLIAEGRLLGTLSFASRRKDEFDPDEIEFLQTICRYVTAAYERVRLIRQLRDTDQRKDEFLATLAHELRNPLAPIRNALEIMRVTGADAATVQQAARTMIERQLAQMVRLIDDLLDVSRITRGRLGLRKERVDLASVVKSAVDTSKPLIDASGHALDVALPDEPLYLDADPVRLAQVFSNLLNNAARYMDRGGRIWLTATAGDDEVTIVVRDTGIGIPPAALPTIFDMFTQVDEALTHSQGGLGIGLTLVKRLVDLHGGRVTAQSEGLGKGATFTVRLPLADHRDVPQPAVPVQRRRNHTITRRVLVADDNRDAAESMGMLLRLMGNEVRTVHDGVEAVEEAETFQPDVILLDIGMPRLNGYDAARQIRGQDWSAGTMLVALTGWGQEDDKRRATEAGFDRHFTKPVNPADLEKLIAEARPD
jgi:PAS domain S-box-containing protein